MRDDPTLVYGKIIKLNNNRRQLLFLDIFRAGHCEMNALDMHAKCLVYRSSPMPMDITCENGLGGPKSTALVLSSDSICFLIDCFGFYIILRD
jgi:hypothetical protein